MTRKFDARRRIVGPTPEMLCSAVAILACFSGCATDTRGWIDSHEEWLAANPGFYALSKQRRIQSYFPPLENSLLGCSAVEAAILLRTNEIWVGLTTGDRRQIPNAESGYDWAALSETLAEYREYPYFESGHYRYIQLTADDDVAYRDILAAVDNVVAHRFTEISFREPQDCDIRFEVP